MTNSEESDGSPDEDEETNENSLPKLQPKPIVDSVSGTRSLTVGEEIGEDNILQLPQDLANVSSSVVLMLYFCTQFQTIRDGRNFT